MAEGPFSGIGRRAAVRATIGVAACLVTSAPAMAAPAEPRWADERRVGPFVCRATFPIDDRLLGEADLEELGRELRRVLGLRECRESIDLLLLRNGREHKRLVTARHPDAPYRRALFYKSRGRSVIYAYRGPELTVDLRHECTHALLHADLPMTPLWLDEGLAEYFEQLVADRPFGQAGRIDRLVREARIGRLQDLRRLERQHELADLSEADYRQAWAWVHFLLHGPPEVRRQLDETLSALRRREIPGLMSERLAAVLPAPRAALAAHLRDWPRSVGHAARSGVDRRGLFR